jgi:hypothetical protein
VEHDRDVGAVIVGFDREVNYFKLQNAQLCINEVRTGCYLSQLPAAAIARRVASLCRAPRSQ